jgi:hypothetical protein
MQIIANDAGRELSESENSFIKRYFSKAATNKMKYLGVNGEVIKSDSHSHELCNVYTCINKSSITEVYSSLNGSYIESIGPKFRNEICQKSEYQCIDFNTFYVTYNCIGWALGISKWLEPAVITNYIKKGASHNQAIERFLIDIKTEYPNDHISNFANIVDTLTIREDYIFSYPSHNLVAFYFNKETCLHGSRFIESVEEKTIEQWSSKLGQGPLVSHNYHDFLYENSLYGDTPYYCGEVDTINDEL